MAARQRGRRTRVPPQRPDSHVEGQRATGDRGADAAETDDPDGLAREHRIERRARLAEALRAGRLSSVELTQGLLNRIDALGGPLNAFLTLDREGAQVSQGVARVEDALPRLGQNWQATVASTARL